MLKKLMYSASKTTVITMLVFLSVTIGFQLIGSQEGETLNKAVGLVLVSLIPFLLAIGIFIKKKV